MALLNFKEVSKIYNDGEIKVNALMNVNLTLDRGEFVAIIGPSGCGKSTLLNLITRLYKPSKGDIYFKEKCIDEYNEFEWKTILQNEIGFIYQNYELIESLDVYSNIELKLNNDRQEKDINNLFIKLDLCNQKKQKVSLLSGGQKQRVGIIRALVNSPSLVLADEPTGALDNENSEILMETLQEYSKKALVVMATHNEELARKYVSKIVHIEHGKVINIEILKEVIIKKDQLINKKNNKLSNKLKIKYLFSIFISFKLRFILLFISGSLIFTFISSLFISLESARGYIDNQYIYLPLYNVFNLKSINNDEVNINKDVLLTLKKDYPSYIRENIDELIQTTLFNKININDKIINNYQVRCLKGKLPSKSLLIGRNIKSFNEIIINKNFAKSFVNGEEEIDSLVGKTISINSEYEYRNEKIVYKNKLEIVGISIDSIYSQNKEIYLDYECYFNYLKDNYVINNMSLFDCFFSFDYQIAILDRKEVSEIINSIKTNSYYIKKDDPVIHEYNFIIKENIYYEEREMFQELVDVVSLIVYFFLFVGIVIFTIFISYVLSSLLLEKRKDFAIFYQLGRNKKDIYSLLFLMALVIALLMIIGGLSLLTIILLIIQIPIKIYIPFLNLFLVIFLFFLLSFISLIMPIISLNKLELGKIMRYE